MQLEQKRGNPDYSLTDVIYFFEIDGADDSFHSFISKKYSMIRLMVQV